MNNIVDLIDLINYRINTVNSYPQESHEWSEALDRISKHIKDLEGRLKSMPDLPSEIKEARLSVSVDREGKARATIEIPAGRRIISYSDFYELFRNPEENQIANDDKNNTDKNSLLDILKDAVMRSKDKFADAGNFEVVLRDLKKHRETVPKEDENLYKKGQWFKELAKTLFSLKIIEPAIKTIKDEIPKIWNQLTFKQKIQAALLGPVIGVGIFVGKIGVAGFGTAIGIPLILVILILLFVTNGLIEFLDFCINLKVLEVTEVQGIRRGKKASGKIALAIGAMTPLVETGNFTSKEIVSKAYEKVKDKGVAIGTVNAQLQRGFKDDKENKNNFEFIIVRDPETKTLSFSKNRPVICLNIRSKS